MKVRYFAWMKKTVGVPEEEVTPPAGIDTVGDLIVWLRGRSPGHAEALAEGAAFGATTGRPRPCGWIDLPQLRYTIMLNGVTQLVVTKIDVLNKLPEIKMATAYETNGKPTQQLPFDLCDDTCQPFYESFPGWETDLERAATYGMLPETAQAFITELEEQLEVPVTMVSTGPGRRQLLEKVQG